MNSISVYCTLLYVHSLKLQFIDFNEKFKHSFNSSTDVKLSKCLTLAGSCPVRLFYQVLRIQSIDFHPLKNTISEAERVLLIKADISYLFLLTKPLPITVTHALVMVYNCFPSVPMCIPIPAKRI